ncbi:hypothetical protein LLG46_05965 [bacterium]|nr:hypothetical protein [bacterium]
MLKKTPFAFLLCLLLTSLLPASCSLAQMTVNDTIRNGTQCVYAIPQDEKQADALSYIKRSADSISPGQEPINAAMTSDSMLKEKLKGGFVLFTTLGEGSKLFEAAIQPLNMQIVGGRLHWNDLNVHITDDLRIMLVGKNPYGDGYCVVFAAGSNASLIGVNSIWASRNCSCAIAQGGKVLKEVNYSRRFMLPRDRIPQAEAAADAQQFFSTVQRVHPDPLAKVSLEDYIKLKQQTVDDIANKVGNDGKIAMTDFVCILYYAAAFFQDGHTSFHWSPPAPTPETIPVKRLPPFLLDYDNGRFTVAASSDKSIEGLEIISVDGRPILEFLRPALDRISGETLAWKASRFTRNFFYYYYFDMCGSAESLTLRLRDAQGKESERKVATVSLAEFQSRDWNRHPNKLQERRNQGTHVEFFDSGNIAYLVYPSFRLDDDEKKKIDGAFRAIKDKGSLNLIIDIRGNGGGASAMGDFLFSYLYPGKFHQYSKVRTKLSRDVRSDAEVASYNGLPQDADLDGMVITQEIEEHSAPKPDAFFSGRVFLLVDNGTFSGASCFAAMFRDYSVGTILGYETGGLPVTFGNLYMFELNNSGIVCGVSFKQFLNAKPRQGDDEHGVIPDIAMNDKLLLPYQKEDDPVLTFTIDHIKHTRRRQ